MFGTSTAILPVRPVTRLEALREIANDSSRAACSTRSRVCGDTVDRPRSVRETVEETLRPSVRHPPAWRPVHQS